MTDCLHPGTTTTGQHYAEPIFKLLHVIKQKQLWKLSLRSLTFSWQCTSAQVCSTEPSCLQSRLGFQWLFTNKKSEEPSSWNLIYSRWITEDRCEGTASESIQKILFSTHNQLKSRKMHWRCRIICQKMRVCVIEYVNFYSQVLKPFDRTS